MLNPLPQFPSTGSRFGLIKHPKQRSTLFFGAHGLGQLQIAACVDIHLKVLPFLVEVNVFDIGDILFLHLADIVEQRTQCTYHGMILQMLGVGTVSELRLHRLCRPRILKSARLIGCNHG